MNATKYRIYRGFDSGHLNYDFVVEFRNHNNLQSILKSSYSNDIIMNHIVNAIEKKYPVNMFDKHIPKVKGNSSDDFTIAQYSTARITLEYDMHTITNDIINVKFRILLQYNRSCKGTLNYEYIGKLNVDILSNIPKISTYMGDITFLY